MILKQEEDLALIRGAWICLKFIKVSWYGKDVFAAADVYEFIFIFVLMGMSYYSSFHVQKQWPWQKWFF